MNLTQIVDQLKLSIISKAMQGKLTKQVPNDGTADKLLQSVQQKKKELVKVGKIKKYKTLPTINGNKILFQIPKNWRWERLGNLVAINSGLNYKKGNLSKNKNDIRIIRGGNISNNGKLLLKDNDYRISSKFINNKKVFLKENQLIMPVSTSPKHTAKVAIVPSLNSKIVAGGFIYQITPYSYQNVCSRFMLYELSDNKIKQEILNISHVSGSALCNTPKTKLKRILVPVPPLAEQKRIVKKLNAILPHVKLACKYIHNAQYIISTYPHDMKQSLLMEAMKGKLTKQLSSDGTADDLLKQIKQEKQKLIKAGKIHKHKPLPKITKSEIPFNIPKNWKWVRLGTIGSWKSGSTPKRSNKSYYCGKIPWLKTGDLTNSYVNHTSEHISQGALNNSSLRLNPVGSVLIAMYGATIAKLGILNIASTTNQACCACIPYIVNNKFLFYYLMSQKYNLINLGSGGAQPNISRTKIIHYLIPLPPLAEQKRIVTKLKSMFNVLTIIHT